MFNIIDMIGLAVILLSALVAFKRGFVKTFFGFISTFIAIILAFALCNKGVELLKQNTELDEILEITITKAIGNQEDAKETDATETQESQNKISEVLSNLPETIQDAVGIEAYKTNIKTTLVEKSVEIILKVLAWVIIYLVVRIILMVICVIFNGIMNVPFLKQINNLAGLIIGAILGLFRVYVALALISFLVSFISMDYVVELIKNSMIISAMYDHNLLLNMIF